MIESLDNAIMSVFPDGNPKNLRVDPKRITADI